MRFTLPLSLAGLALFLTCTLAGAANARTALRPDRPELVASLRARVDHYRAVTWTYERASHDRRTPTSFSYRRSSDPAYLEQSLRAWTRRADAAQRRAVADLHRRLRVPLPRAPRPPARLSQRLSYTKRLALSLRRIYPGHITRTFASAKAPTARETLRLWQRRSSLAALEVSMHGVAIPARLYDSFLCIHRFEGSWTANSGNGYFGGLQMDLPFQSLYGPEFLARWGTADNWPVSAQLQAAVRAYQSGRGFTPWPNTAQLCGLR